MTGKRERGSIRHKLADVVAAARTFVQCSSSVNFNEHVTTGLRAAVQVTDRPDELADAILPPIGMTALYDAVVRAREQLRAGTPDKKVLIVISDGGDNASTHKLGEVLKMAIQRLDLHHWHF